MCMCVRACVCVGECVSVISSTQWAQHNIPSGAACYCFMGCTQFIGTNPWVSRGEDGKYRERETKTPPSTEYRNAEGRCL